MIAGKAHQKFHMITGSGGKAAPGIEEPDLSDAKRYLPTIVSCMCSLCRISNDRWLIY